MLRQFVVAYSVSFMICQSRVLSVLYCVFCQSVIVFYQSRILYCQSRIIIVFCQSVVVCSASLVFCVVSVSCIVRTIAASAGNKGTIINVIAICSKMFIACAWTTMETYTVELYPTVIR